ncbi:prepilin-type N-terminal cleavage/methylation domain-containing protein [Yersinia enterocolitica]|nr:prepilin-type N-terminal cleavage/methylation domain-containing protein [Yersinia enterocolitica]QBQ01108.1 prepilin-type N-terminal cleavage/methylation domain-containing protein [Yersinia enterocolitica subsp. palearctica]EKN4927983.1 prepilin-type N-terminal cleavage/methylation domain-containing protein [Yersinia enterocolitica]EKN4931908.1 prepilin-type N-terminal cleavage/methylation domain-containing protein [Yersinia enterocolitica]EKN5014338.1 prepilin-type N-terminal cleavage/methy
MGLRHFLKLKKIKTDKTENHRKTIGDYLSSYNGFTLLESLLSMAIFFRSGY